MMTLLIYLEYLKYLFIHKINVIRVIKKEYIVPFAWNRVYSGHGRIHYNIKAVVVHNLIIIWMGLCHDLDKISWKHMYNKSLLINNNEPKSGHPYTSMIIDWKALSLQEKTTPQEYYLKNYYNFDFSYGMRMDIEHTLNLNQSMYHNYGHILSDLIKLKAIGGDRVFILDEYNVDVYEYIDPYKFDRITKQREGDKSA